MSSVDELREEARSFINECQTAVLATVSPEGAPLASYAPFVFHEESFYILVSNLAAHTRNLTTSTQCHVMLIRDEGQSPNLFGRQRLSFPCEIESVARENEQFPAVILAMRERHGPVVSMLENLPDFVLMRLQPGNGNFVQGFGRAATIRLN
ncbi:MAG: pyridoxamine 5'-phosphate oxidase family protein [Pirellulaceae bacterium]